MSASKSENGDAHRLDPELVVRGRGFLTSTAVTCTACGWLHFCWLPAKQGLPSPISRTRVPPLPFPALPPSPPCAALHERGQGRPAQRAAGGVPRRAGGAPLGPGGGLVGCVWADSSVHVGLVTIWREKMLHCPLFGHLGSCLGRWWMAHQVHLLLLPRIQLRGGTKRFKSLSPNPMQDLKGHLYPFCRDQHGSRLVQQQLESADAALVAGARANCCTQPCCRPCKWGSRRSPCTGSDTSGDALICCDCVGPTAFPDCSAVPSAALSVPSQTCLARCSTSCCR